MSRRIDNYTLKEVIERRFNDMGVCLSEIRLQTTKTNGRVISLEQSRAQLWTAIAILILLGGVLVTLSVMVIDSKIKDAVVKNFAEYEINNSDK